MDGSQTVREADELCSDGFETQSLRQCWHKGSIQQQFDMGSSLTRVHARAPPAAGRIAWTVGALKSCQEGAFELV